MLFVTGGSRGIGRAIVVKAIEEGYRVAFTYRSSEAAAAEVVRDAARIDRDRLCRAYQLDVRIPAAVTQVVGRVLADFGEISSVILNAGITCNQLVVSTLDEVWNDVIDTNLSGPFRVVREFVPTMLKQRRGSFVFIGSIAQEGMSGAAAYATSKAGLIGLSAALARDYGRQGIRSNLMVVGPIETDLTRNVSSANRAFAVECSTLGRPGMPEEVASAALFLASEKSSFVNGAALSVSGGVDWMP